jgi:hypothetical protein
LLFAINTRVRVLQGLGPRPELRNMAAMRLSHHCDQYAY